MSLPLVQSALQFVFTVALATSTTPVASQPVFTAPSRMVDQIAASELSTGLVRRFDTATAVANAAPLPQADATASPGSLGATDIFSYSESAYQTLEPVPVKIRTVDPLTHVASVGQRDIADAIVQSAAKEGVDPLIVEVIIKHESAFDAAATSGVGACGLMQLMPETARELGVTDLNDPIQNIAAGTHYFAEQYRHFHNLHLALAAYNAGPGAVEQFGGVPPYEETVNYANSIASEYAQRRALR